MGGRCKVLVPASSPSTFRDQESLPGLGEVMQHFTRFGVVNDGANRNG
jgi:hypothetical protein